jgi:hypothetical protein
LKINCSSSSAILKTSQFSDATGNVSIVAADVNNGSTILVEIDLLELQNFFTCTVGANTVTLKATDENGNSDSNSNCDS